MKRKLFLKIILGLICFVVLLIISFKIYCSKNEYLYTVGRYQDTVEGPAIKLYYSPYLKNTNQDYLIFMHTENDDMFEKLESGDIIFLVHSNIIEMNECSTRPVFYLKINKGIYDLIAK